MIIQKTVRELLGFVCAVTILAAPVPVDGAGIFNRTVFSANITGAAVFTVNSNGDSSDNNIGDNICETATAGECTLRAAIEEANVLMGVETIEFNIPGPVPHTISPSIPLPDIIEGLTINGYSQPGSSPNTSTGALNTVIGIELNGSGAGAGVDGLRLLNGFSTIRGLAINRFTGDGISLVANSDSNTITGCFIGTNVAGTMDLGNLREGISSDVTFFPQAPESNVIGGLTPAERNLISGNNRSGIDLLFSSGNTIRGNIIGLDASGTMALGNTLHGINSDSGNTIGGITPAARNIISANGDSGIVLDDTNTVHGNYIGTDINGTADLGNTDHGISMNASFNNQIGGTVAGSGNVISGNNVHGIFVGNSGSNMVQGNLIGTDSGGSNCLGNGTHGIFMFAGNQGGNTIGGTAAGASNTIACNSGDGVNVDPTFGVGNLISMNSIFSNGDLGIDLGPNGVTPNDPGDGDTGPNNLQNFPVIDFVLAGSTRVGGSLDSTPNTMFRLEFFNSPTADISGNGEGQTIVGSIDVMTNGTGTAVFDHVFAYTSPLNTFITSTATNLTTNDTSEFSLAKAVLAPTAAVVEISGRVLRNSGRGIPGARLTITLENGDSFSRLTNHFGYYRFVGVPAGQTAIVAVFSKRDRFSPSSYVLNIDNDISGFNIVALPE